MREFTEREMEIIKDAFAAKEDITIDIQGVIVRKDDPTVRLCYKVKMKESYDLEAFMKAVSDMQKHIHHSMWV